MDIFPMKIMRSFSILFVCIFQFVLSDNCSYKGSSQGQNVKLDDLINAQKINLCDKIIISNIDITCDGSTQTPNSDNLLDFTVNNIEISNSQILCDNLQIEAKEAVLNNVVIGTAKTDRCCSFMSQYNFYLLATGDIILSGEIKHQKEKYGMLLFNSKKSFLISNANIQAGNIALHSVNYSTISKSSLTSLFIFCNDELQSTTPNNEKLSPDEFMQIKFAYKKDKLTAEYQIVSIEELSQKYDKNNQQQSEYNILNNALKYSYSILLYSESSIRILQSSVISGSKISIFSVSADIEANSILNTNGYGCPANYGLGKGLYLDTSQNCSPNGANQASLGGIGLPKPNQNGQFPEGYINSCIFYLQQSSFVLQNIPYSYFNVYEGSGGAYSNQQKSFGILGSEGAGGGIITIFTSSEVTINGSLSSNGNSLENFDGSGASGGAVIVKSTKIHGKGIISVKGGDSDKNGLSGEGAGGLVSLYQLNWDLEDNLNQFNGTITINQGSRNLSKYNLPEETKSLLQASSGTFISFVCPDGFEPQSNGFCKQCQQGYYKSGSVGKCKKCTKPSQFDRVVKNIPNQTSFNSLSDCFLNCNEFNCDPLRFYVRNVISLNGIPYILVYVFVLCLGYVSRRILRMKPKKLDSIPIQHVKYDYDDSLFARECKEKDIFFYRDLLYHKYRIQFYGENSINCPWFLQLQIPQGTEQIFDQRDFAEFALKINQILEWKKMDRIILTLMNYFYYPLYWWYLIKVQKKIYKKVLNKIHDEPYPKFLKGSNVVHQEHIRMKITKSDDYTLLYLDLFNYNKRNQKYFKKTMPTIIHFSGDGGYLKPYYIWPRDHFLQSVFYSSNSRTIRNKGNPNDVNVFCQNYKYHMQNSQRFEEFITELNKISSTLDFYANKKYLIKCFQEMVSHCKKFNDEFLYDIHLKLHILIMEIPFNDPMENSNPRITSQLSSLQQSYKQRITLIEDENSPEFLEAVNRIHKYKIEQKPLDIKISMFIFSTVEDTEDLQKHLTPELEIEQEQVNHYEFASQINMNPFGSALEYQSTKPSKLLDYQQVAFQSVLQSKVPFDRNSMNKQTVADYMQSCIEKQNIQMMNEEEKQEDEKEIQKLYKKKQRIPSKLFVQFGIIMGCVRSLFLSHKNSKTDKEVLIYTLTILIITDMFSLTFFYNNIYYAQIENFGYFDYILLFIPFPFVILLSPFIGLFLLTNQSYGMGKAFLIFNFMSLIIMSVSLFLSLCYIPIDGFHFPIFFLKLFSIVVKIFISYCGKSSLLVLTKLNKTTTYKK